MAAATATPTMTARAMDSGRRRSIHALTTGILVGVRYNPVMPRISDDVRALQPDMIALRRELHQNPELAYAETRTAARVAGLLEKAGMEVRTGVGGTGVLAGMRGARGPAVLLRADM